MLLLLTIEAAPKDDSNLLHVFSRGNQEQDLRAGSTNESGDKALARQLRMDSQVAATRGQIGLLSTHYLEATQAVTIV